MILTQEPGDDTTCAVDFSEHCFHVFIEGKDAHIVPGVAPKIYTHSDAKDCFECSASPFRLFKIEAGGWQHGFGVSGCPYHGFCA